MNSATSPTQQAEQQIATLIKNTITAPPDLGTDHIQAVLTWADPREPSTNNAPLSIAFYVAPTEIPVIDAEHLSALSSEDYQTLLHHLHQQLALLTPFTADSAVEHVEHWHWHGNHASDFIEYLRDSVYYDGAPSDTPPEQLMQQAQADGIITPDLLAERIPERYRYNYNRDPQPLENLAARNPQLTGLTTALANAEATPIPDSADLQAFASDIDHHSLSSPIATIITPVAINFVCELYDEIIQADYDNGTTELPIACTTLKDFTPSSTSNFITHLRTTLQRFNAELNTLAHLP